MLEPLGETKNGEGLAIACGLDGNIAVKLQIVAHSCAVRNLRQYPITIDVGHDQIERPQTRLGTFNGADPQTRRLEQTVSETRRRRHFQIG